MKKHPSLLVPATLPPKYTVRPTPPPRAGAKPIHIPPLETKSTTMSKKDKIRNAQQEARQALAGNNNTHSPSGSLVICDPTTGWNKNAQVVKTQFLLAGLDPDVLLPSPPDYGTAFSRSILPIQQMCQGRGYTLLKAGNGPNGESRYSVSAVQRNGVVETEDRATVICPRDGTAPHVERTTGDPQADEIAAWLVRATHERFNNYSGDLLS